MEISSIELPKPSVYDVTTISVSARKLNYKSRNKMVI